MAATAPHREQRGSAELGPLWTATGPEGTAWSCVRGGAAGGQGKGLHQRIVDMERAAQGHHSKLSEFKKRLDSALRHRV